MSEKHYPTDPRGQEDAGADRDQRRPKPCARRRDLTQRLFGPFVTWCELPIGHEGECSFPNPRSIPPNDFKPRKR